MGILCAKESGFHICCTNANVYTNIKFLSCPLFASSYTEMLNRFMEQMTFQACYRTFLFSLERFITTQQTYIQIQNVNKIYGSLYKT